MILFHQIQLSIVTSQSKVSVKGVKDKAIERTFLIRTLNMTRKSFSYCLARCLEDCLCKSFQVCNIIECELSSTDKDETGHSAFHSRSGCVYYDFGGEDKISNSCGDTCSHSIDCCLTSNPCLHSGVCYTTNSFPSTTRRTRFSCKCPQPYTGPRCNQPIKSCSGYKNDTRKSGHYRIFDNEMKSYIVYCDFDAITSLTWTLLQSHNRVNTHSLAYNSPMSPESPSWTGYRLQKSRMLSIQANSTKWRITCQYNGTTPLTDYVYGAIKDSDILKSNSNCVKVEFIKIREQSCNDCTVNFLQSSSSFIFHFHSATQTKCSFRVSGEETQGCVGADYFGNFACIDKNHACSSSPDATTQIWFGGH